MAKIVPAGIVQEYLLRSKTVKLALPGNLSYKIVVLCMTLEVMRNVMYCTIQNNCHPIFECLAAVLLQ